jgi:hypothetical protein
LPPELASYDHTARKQKQSHNSGGVGTNRYQKYSPQRKFQEKIYVPKAMMDLMISTTANKTSIHFGMNHMCHRHDVLFTIDHVLECEYISESDDIRRYANRLRQQHILEWEAEERLMTIT